MSRQYTLQRAPAPTSIHIDYAAELNEQQLAAVTAAPGPLLVIAGAGSGKTRTLTYRVAYLLENGIDPRNILLLTFTNKAAREMLGRVANLAAGRCQRTLGWHIPFDRKPDFAPARQRARLFERIHHHGPRRSKGFDRRRGDSAQELIRRRFDFRKAMCSRKFSVSSSIQRNRWRNCLRKSFLISCRYSTRFKDVRERYEKKKKATNSMDFDDLLQKTLSMFQQHERDRGILSAAVSVYSRR